MKPALTAEEIGNLVASDASTIGLMIAKGYRSGPEGVALARDIRDIVLALRSFPAVDGVGEPVAYIVHETDVHGRDHWFCDASDYASKVESGIAGVKLTPLYTRSALSPTSDRASVVEECAKVVDVLAEESSHIATRGLRVTRVNAYRNAAAAIRALSPRSS